MGRSVNKIILVGNVGRDPEVQTTSGGNKVAHFSLATSRRIPREAGFEERTEWHRLTVWGRLAELAEEYVRKGDRLYVEGRMEYDSYERNGITIPTSEVLVREMVLLGSGGRMIRADPLPTAVRLFLVSCARELDGTETGDRAAALLASHDAMAHDEEDEDAPVGV